MTRRVIKKIVVRRSDGKLFEPSIPDDYNIGNVLSELLNGTSKWYFREIVEVPKRFYEFKQRFMRTGEVWETNDPGTFDVKTCA